MAYNESERSQREQISQALYDGAPSHGVVGRPRARGVNNAPRKPRPAQPVQQSAAAQRVRQPAQQQDLFGQIPLDEPAPVQRPPQQPQQLRQPRQRGRARNFEKTVYGSGASRTRVREAPPQGGGKSNAVTWLLVVLVLLLLAVAGYLVFLLFNGGIGNLSLGGAGRQALPAGGALLAETADAGEAYVAQTIFVGDSNFERLREYGLVDAGTVAAKVGIGAEGITTDAFIEVTGQGSPLTIAQTMAAIGPTRMLVMIGTNDVPTLSVDEFVLTYKTALAELRKAAPNASLVVAAIPPVASWKDSEMLNASAVRQFNEALLAMCEAEGYAYLDAYAALADESGYLPEADTDDGYHLTQSALEKLLQYYRTHAYNP